MSEKVRKMATRCTITMRGLNGREYRIYRHYDGYPEGVVSDLWVFTQLYNRSFFEDPEYFLADFIFYAKLAWMKSGEGKIGKYRHWEYGYGVCAPDCEHGDLEYKYLIYPKNGKVMLKIERIDYESREFREVFNDEIEEAFKRWAREDGCHLRREWLPSP